MNPEDVVHLLAHKLIDGDVTAWHPLADLLVDLGFPNAADHVLHGHDESPGRGCTVTWALANKTHGFEEIEAWSTAKRQRKPAPWNRMFE